MDPLLRGRARSAEVDQTDGVGEPAQGREDDVRFDVHPDREAIAFAVFREVADAQMHRIRRALDVRDLAVDEDGPRLRTVRAEDGARDFRPPRADEARQAEYFAAPQVEAHVADHPPSVQTANVEDDLR